MTTTIMTFPLTLNGPSAIIRYLQAGIGGVVPKCRVEVSMGYRLPGNSVKRVARDLYVPSRGFWVRRFSNALAF